MKRLNMGILDGGLARVNQIILANMDFVVVQDTHKGVISGKGNLDKTPTAVHRSARFC